MTPQRECSGSALWVALVLSSLAGLPARVGAQAAPAASTTAPAGSSAGSEIVNRSAFEVSASKDDGSGRGGDNGYPLTAQLPDGSLVTVYYLTRDGITGVAATRWKIPW